MTMSLERFNISAPRLARAPDALALHALVDAAYAAYPARMGRKPAPMLDNYAARIAAGQAWVIEQAGEIVGLLVLEEKDGLLIDNVAVAPQLKGHGLGRRLMAFAEQEAARRGIRRIWLYTHVTMVENIAMYPALGFRETHRGTESGFERVYFERFVDN
jgi:ribosomal protein S18 acetylase RimI-like enzyme